MQKIHKITRVAKRSLAVILPAELIKSLSWREKQRVIIKRVPRGFMIIDAKSKKRNK